MPISETDNSPLTDELSSASIPAPACSIGDYPSIEEEITLPRFWEQTHYEFIYESDAESAASDISKSASSANCAPAEAVKDDKINLDEIKSLWPLYLKRYDEGLDVDHSRFAKLMTQIATVSAKFLGASDPRVGRTLELARLAQERADSEAGWAKVWGLPIEVWMKIRASGAVGVMHPPLFRRSDSLV